MQKRLLVIDDSKRFAGTIARTAGVLGYTAMPCTDPHAALDAFLSFRPDVVMLDLCLPEKDGFDIANEILLTGLPVRLIFTSGYGAALLRAAKDVASFHDSDNVTFLSKPFRREEFSNALDKIFPVTNDGREAESQAQAAD